MLYFAYGSNLNRAHMAYRCPQAKPLASFTLPDWRLVFRGVADCIEEPGAECPGGIWKITAACERALDRYEGIAAGLYRKVHLPVIGAGDEYQLMLYVMNSTGIMPPTESYLQTIIEGYRDFDLDVAPLEDAVRHAWADKDKTYFERRRRHRDGYKRLALPAAVPPAKTGKAATGKQAASKRPTGHNRSKSK
jgi:hypothetical protein